MNDLGRPRVLLLGAAGRLAAGAIHGALGAGFEIVEAWTVLSPGTKVRRLDRRLGLVAPHWSVAALLARHRIPVRQVPRLAAWDGAAETARATGAGILISAGFTQRVPKPVLDAFPGRAFNLHPALLPRRRGPDPILAALVEGTIAIDGGVTLHVMDETFDTGDIVAQRAVRFDARRPHAYDFALASAAAWLVGRELPRHLAGALPALPQVGSQVTAARITHADFAVGPHLPFGVAERRLALVGPLHPFRPTGRPDIAVRGPARKIGPATGAPPAVGLRSVELDVADARIRLTRRQGPERWAATIRRYAEALVARRPTAVVWGDMRDDRAL